MGPPNPRRLKFGSERNDKQHAKRSVSCPRPDRAFQACGVDPMHVLENHQHRILDATAPPLRSERFQCSLSALLRVSSSVG